MEPIFALNPQSRFSHQLKVTTGNGLTGPTEPIALSTSQLYDLTTALEQFRLQLLKPDPSGTTESALGFWRLSAIALAGIVAIGVTSVMVRQWKPNGAVVDSDIAPIPAKNSFQFQPVMPAIPPSPRKTTKSPQLAPTLALRDPLPPPTSLATASPPP